MVGNANTIRQKKNFASSAKKQKEEKYHVRNAGKSEKCAMWFKSVQNSCSTKKIPVLILQ